MPTQFVQIAEDSNLIVPIGRWVLREACQRAKIWSNAGLGSISIGVNISAPEFRSLNFIDDIQAILIECGLEPRCLELELTEAVLLRDIDFSVVLLTALKAIGVQLTVDDFGTGYSSLSYLRQLHVDSLKIDRSLLLGVTQASDDALIVSAAISLGKNLHQRVVAEGVEEHKQFIFLSTHDCEEAQGFYFSYPLIADQFAKLLGTGISRGLLN